MKLALMLDHFDSRQGGLERYAADWTGWLAKRGHEVHVVAGGGVSPTDKAIVLHRVDVGGLGPLARARRLADQATALAPDVLHDLGAGLGGDIFQPLSGARLASRAGEFRSLDVARRWRRRLSIPWVRRQAALDALERRRLQRPNGIVVACSPRVADDLVRLAGASPERIRILYNAVDCRDFIPTPPAERAALRQSQGWPATGTLFLEVAHNFRLKGVAQALSAMALLSAEGCEAYLAVAGAGPHLDPYRAQASRLGIAARVRFLGPLDDPRPYFAAADALLHPAFYDACSLACLEAWASGLPVVVSREDGASGLLTEGVQGWVIRDPGDAREIAFRMKELLDPGRREAMGVQARILAEHHDAADAFPQLEALCREAAANN